MSLEGFEQALLESGGGDAPPGGRRAASRAAVLRAVGVSAALAVATLSSTSAAAAGAGAGAGTATTAKAIGIVKLVLLAVCSLAVAVAVATRGREPTEEALVTPDPRANAPRQSASVLVPMAPAGVPLVSVDDLPRVATAIATTSAGMTTPRDRGRPPKPAESSRPLGRSGSLSAAPRDPLAVEVALLEAARACLARGDDVCAGARLAEHRARFAEGVLAAEAELLAARLKKVEAERNATDASEEKR